MKHHLLIAALSTTVASIISTPCLAANIDVCAGSLNVGGNSFGASVASVSATHINVTVFLCWSGPGVVSLGLGNPTYSLEFRDSTGNLVATKSKTIRFSPGHPIALAANNVISEGTVNFSIPQTVTVPGTYSVTVTQTFAYLLPGQTKPLRGTLFSAPFQVTIP